MVTSRLLGDLLLKERIISQKHLEDCLAKQKKTGGRLVDILISENLTDERSLISFLSKHFRLPIMDLADFHPDNELLQLVPISLCAKYCVLPVGRRGETLVIATSDPSNVQCIDDIRFHARSRIEQVLGYPSAIRSFIERIGGVDIRKLAESINNEQGAEAIESDMQVVSPEDETTEDDAPIIQFVSAVLLDAIRKKASDIHIEPYETDLRVRLRIDGDLRDSVRPPANIRNALVARIKVMAKMRIDERRLPQDGRVRFRLPEGGEIDFRVNTLPTVNGEKVVLRILDKSNAAVSFEQLGFEPDDLEKFRKAVTAPWGIVLVTGATGSGKTTTLYSAINMLNTNDVNISTIEDPVEYKFAGINQVQTKEQIGLTFAETLRALLRQDPDIILLGEIRDGETAEIAFKAALTGHMVLSTLHTNDAASTIMRLKDMGIDPFLVNSALLCVVSQRLVRKVCLDCRAPDTRQTPETLKRLGFPENVIGKFQPMHGKGCPKCSNSGFRGRCAVHEVLEITDSLREKIGSGATTLDIRRAAVASGMRGLRINTMRKVMRGIVSVDELLQVGGE
ncbi:MAG: type IV-A pilus assembly ATPase PilB [Bdellovibrionales bacterium]|nr:type IV-A pilus assembly ATPase PilB [Bdellovibrionales bacterium]